MGVLLLSEEKFCDISNHQPSTRAYIQGIKDWGAKAVVIKTTEGDYFIDKTAADKKALIEEMGMLCHAYHFSHFASNAEARAEAEFFSSRCEALGFDKAKTIMVNDVESPYMSTSKSALTEHCNTFTDRLKELGWQRVDTYSGASWFTSRLDQSQLHANNFWCASYGAHPHKNFPGVKFNAWQYAADPQYGEAVYINGVVTDCNIDYNGFYTTPQSGGGGGTDTPSEPIPEPEAPGDTDELNKLFEEILADATLKLSSKEWCTSILGYLPMSQIFDKPPWLN